MNRVALVAAILCVGAAARAQPAVVTDVGPDGLGLVDRTEPAKELKRLDKGDYAERARVIARATDAAPRSDEALALLAYAAERARPLELREHELVTLARGLARRGATKPARDALFAVLTTPPPEGFDGQALHQRIAAFALAQVADLSDPPPSGLPPAAGAAPDPQALRGTLDKLLDLADEPRFVETITQALLRHPPRGLPRGAATAGSLHVGAQLGDLRWAAVLENALATTNSNDVRQAAVEAARALGDTRALPRVLGLLNHPNPELSAAAFSAWVSFDPSRALPELEKRLRSEQAQLPLLALAHATENPTVLGVVAARLGAETASRGAEAARILATLPNGAGVSALQKLSRSDGSLHLAIDSLAATPGSRSTQALITLLGDARPTARHEASFALLARALGSDADAHDAHAALDAATHVARPLSTVVRHWLASQRTPRMHAAAHAYEAARTSPQAQVARAECARALRAEAPACAFAFGAALPRTPTAAEQTELQSLLASPDPAVAGELHAGLVQSAWAGRFVALEHAEATPLRRRLAALAATHPEADDVLARSVGLVRAGEPDLVVARLLAGKDAGLRPRPRLVRADPDGRVRCGYARDEANGVIPFVVEEGGAYLPAARGTVLELTFTPCHDSVLKQTGVR